MRFGPTNKGCKRRLQYNADSACGGVYCGESEFCTGSSRLNMKWLLRNFSERRRFTLRNPRHALGSLYRELARTDERFLSTITGVSTRRIRAFLEEPIHTRTLLPDSEKRRKHFES
jgi:hypothetical protein